MPSSRANTAVDLMAVGGGVQVEFKPDLELYKQRESTGACALVAQRTTGDAATRSGRLDQRERSEWRAGVAVV